MDHQPTPDRLAAAENAITSLNMKDRWDPADYRQMGDLQAEACEIKAQIPKAEIYLQRAAYDDDRADYWAADAKRHYRALAALRALVRAFWRGQSPWSVRDLYIPIKQLASNLRNARQSRDVSRGSAAIYRAKAAEQVPGNAGAISDAIARIESVLWAPQPLPKSNEMPEAASVPGDDTTTVVTAAPAKPVEPGATLERCDTITPYDLFAAAVITGLISKYGPEDPIRCAEIADQYADAMMARRKA